MRRLCLLLPIAMLAGCGRSAPPPPIPDGDPFADIPGVRFDHYAVHGMTVDAIRKSLDAAGPIDPNDGSRQHALARWRMHWEWDGDGAGRCDLSTTRTRFSATVLLPRLSGDVPAETRAQWDRYLAALRHHEAGHVRAAYDRRGEVHDAVSGATCETANAAGDAAIARLAEGDVKHDRATRHGIEQGAVL